MLAVMGKMRVRARRLGWGEEIREVFLCVFDSFFLFFVYFCQMAAALVQSNVHGVVAHVANGVLKVVGDISSCVGIIKVRERDGKEGEEGILEAKSREEGRGGMSMGEGQRRGREDVTHQMKRQCSRF